MHARQLDGVVQKSGAKDESSRFGTLTMNGLLARIAASHSRKRNVKLGT